MNVDQAKIDTVMRIDVVELLNLKTQVLMGSWSWNQRNDSVKRS